MFKHNGERKGVFKEDDMSLRENGGLGLAD
jgi:hypothetical protein